tara:strand:+ start:2237 stop:2680 length:444 start_codon:yes stop_codon:yes gene_type:complete
MVLGMFWRRNSARKEKRPQKENSRSIPLPMLMDGPYSIVEANSGRRGRRNERTLHLPQYVSCEEPESLVQGEVGGRIEEGPKNRQTSSLWTVKGKIIRKGLPEMQTLSKGIEQDPEDFWFDVKWTETGRNKKKAGQEAGCWWETDDC